MNTDVLFSFVIGKGGKASQRLTTYFIKAKMRLNLFPKTQTSTKGNLSLS